MSHQVHHLTHYLFFVVATFALTTALNAAQDAETPAAKPAESEKQSQTAEKPVEKPLSVESNNKADGIVSEWSPWAKAPEHGTVFDYFPAKTETYSTPEEAKSNLDSALRTTFADLLNRKLGNLEVALELTPPPAKLKEKYAGDNVWEILRLVEGDKTSYRAAIRMTTSPYEFDYIIDNYRRNRQQLSAIQRTCFIGSGLIVFIGILAFQAKLNHATNGKRAGILRAASAIAILSLLGGFITAAALSGIFSA